ncbi:MAG: helix-turn-helix transcriptional regulator [Bacilli bacterium]
MNLQNNSLYIDDTAENVGAMLEYASNEFEDINYFWNQFIASKLVKEIEKENPIFVAGHSGMDYFYNIVENNIKKIINNKPLTYNKYFWAGEMIAKYQNITGLSYYDIEAKIPLKKVLKMYSPLHETDINKIFSTIDSYTKTLNEDTNLKKIRQASGLSQSKLSFLSKVDLRSIQMYEQRRNDINKSQTQTLSKLAKILGCNIEDLLEK